MEKSGLRHNTKLSQLHQRGNLLTLWTDLCLWGNKCRYKFGSFTLPIFPGFLRTVHWFKKYDWQNLTLMYQAYLQIIQHLSHWILDNLEFPFKKRKTAYHFPSSFSYCWTVYPNMSSRGPLKVIAFFTSTLEEPTRWRRALKKKVICSNTHKPQDFKEIQVQLWLNWGYKTGVEHGVLGIFITAGKRFKTYFLAHTYAAKFRDVSNWTSVSKTCFAKSITHL